MWAPSGGFGTGVIGAHPASNSSYFRTINRSYGAAAIAAGVAAQFLQLNPKATPADVRRALLETLAVNHTVTGLGAGTVAPSRLLTSNLTQAASVQPVDSGGNGSGLSAAAIAGIVVGATAGALY